MWNVLSMWSVMRHFFLIKKESVVHTHHDESVIKERSLFLKLISDSLDMKLTVNSLGMELKKMK
uniref:Putative ovule protein n=1 Tax=Solanum chacoense TaxID=4108 RepID=A0A0V0GK01_SOLCH